MNFLLKEDTLKKKKVCFPFRCLKHNFTVIAVDTPKLLNDISNLLVIKNKSLALNQLINNYNFPATKIFVARNKDTVVGIAVLNTSDNAFSNNKVATLNVKIKKDQSANSDMINDMLVDSAYRYVNKRDDIETLVNKGSDKVIKLQRDLTYHKISDKAEIQELSNFIKETRSEKDKIFNIDKHANNLESNIDNPLLSVFTAKKDRKIQAVATMDIVRDPSMAGYVTVNFDISKNINNFRDRKIIIDGLIKRIEDYTRKMEKDIKSVYFGAPIGNSEFVSIFKRNHLKLGSNGYLKRIAIPQNEVKYQSLAEYTKDRNLLPEKVPVEFYQQLKEKLSLKKANNTYKRLENKLAKVKAEFPEMVIDTIKDSDYNQLSELYTQLNDGIKREPDVLRNLIENYTKNSDYTVITMREKKNGPIMATISAEKHPGLDEAGRSFIHPENLVVDKEYKRKGIGVVMLLMIYKLLFDNNCNVKFLGDTSSMSKFFYRNPLLGLDRQYDYYERDIQSKQ